MDKNSRTILMKFDIKYVYLATLINDLRLAY